MSAGPDERLIYPALSAERAPRAAYIHVPFCIHRCGYCDFTLVAGRDELIPAYLMALAAELQAAGGPYEVDTLFIGGGTPSQLSTNQLTQLLALIRHHLPLAAGGECSLEANPDGLSWHKLQAIADGGVNRLSLGVQSFDSDTLTALERQHTPEEAVAVIERAARLIENISLDLIFGVPGQQQATWDATLQTAIQLTGQFPLQHVSTYGLTFEKGTDFFRRQQSGDLLAVPEERERQMYATAMRLLPQAGLPQYEISSFAADGRECRHNHVYWDAQEYFAFGPGAARYVNGVRSTNARSVTRWLKAWSQGQPALQDSEQLTEEHRWREAVFLGLRRMAGIDLQAFEARFGTQPAEFAPQAFAANIEHGLLEVVDGRMRLTPAGRFVADSVVQDFL